MSRMFLFAAAAALVMVGCAIPLDAPLGLGPVNLCEAPSDCGDGATCAQGKCVATTFDLTGLRVEVRPVANATFGANTSYVLDPAASGVALSSRGSGSEVFLAAFDAQLPAPVSISGGKVLLDPSTPIAASCPIADRSVPARLTFFRIPPFTGFPFEPVSASTGDVGPTYTFAVNLVPDRYDVYLEPQLVPGCNDGVPYPPVFLPNQMITAGGALSWTLPPAGKLSGVIAGLPDDQWTVDLVEPSRGLPISSGGTLTPASGGYSVDARIAWADKSTSPILRLTPLNPTDDPAHENQPTLYWTLAGAVFGGTTTDPEVAFSVVDLAVEAVEVSGTILSSDVSTGVPARLTIQSETLFGENAQNAAFSLDGWPTDAQGSFSVKLPPGNYKIRAVPTQEDGLSITDSELEWPTVGPDMPLMSCVCARTFPLHPERSFGGSVTTATGVPLTSAAVDVAPSQTGARSYWADTHALDPLDTRASSTTTDASGRFSLLVDPGRADLTVQPDPSSSFPWLVRPRFDIEADLPAATFVLSSPGFLSGTVRDPSGAPIANAEIRAWFPVRDPSVAGGLTGTVVEIAATSTDENGAYTLVLPSSI